MKEKISIINESQFHKKAEACRILSDSIISDSDLLSEYNTLSNSQRAYISKQVKNIKKYHAENHDVEFYLHIADIHIISGRHNVDPAVILFTATNKSNGKIVIK